MSRQSQSRGERRREQNRRTAAGRIRAAVARGEWPAQGSLPAPRVTRALHRFNAGRAPLDQIAVRDVEHLFELQRHRCAHCRELFTLHESAAALYRRAYFEIADRPSGAFLLCPACFQRTPARAGTRTGTAACTPRTSDTRAQEIGTATELRPGSDSALPSRKFEPPTGAPTRSGPLDVLPPRT